MTESTNSLRGPCHHTNDVSCDQCGPWRGTGNPLRLTPPWEKPAIPMPDRMYPMPSPYRDDPPRPPQTNLEPLLERILERLEAIEKALKEND